MAIVNVQIEFVGLSSSLPVFLYLFHEGAWEHNLEGSWFIDSTALFDDDRIVAAAGDGLNMMSNTFYIDIYNDRNELQIWLLIWDKIWGKSLE